MLILLQQKTGRVNMKKIIVVALAAVILSGCATGRRCQIENIPQEDILELASIGYDSAKLGIPKDEMIEKIKTLLLEEEEN